MLLGDLEVGCAHQRSDLPADLDGVGDSGHLKSGEGHGAKEGVDFPGSRHFVGYLHKSVSDAILYSPTGRGSMR